MEKIRKISGGVGFIMLMMMAGFEDGTALGFILWLAVTVGLLYFGRAFRWQ